MTLALHVVRNHPNAEKAGHGDLLVPGFTLVASCKKDDDLPTCSFDLPEGNDEPIFIVPSAAMGEQGAFTLCVDANGPVDILEITDENREQWVHKYSTEVRWSSQRPHCRYQ